MSDIFIALQIVCLVGLVYGYTRNRRKRHARQRCYDRRPARTS